MEPVFPMTYLNSYSFGIKQQPLTHLLLDKEIAAKLTKDILELAWDSHKYVKVSIDIRDVCLESVC